MRTWTFGLIAALCGCSLLTSTSGLSGGADAFDAGVADAPSGADTAPPPVADAGSLEADTDAGAPSRYRAAVLADTPLRYYRLGETDGAVARDEMGRADGTYPVDGVRLGAPGALANEPGNAAVRFEGGAVVLPAGAEFDGTKPFSVELWASATSDALGFLVDHESFSGERFGWTLHSDSTSFTFERIANPSTLTAVGAGGQAMSTWHHVVATFDGKTERIYADGSLFEQQNTTVSLPTLGTSFTVGGQNCGCLSNAFSGAIDELAIYAYALTTARIEAHFAAAQ